MKPCFILHLTLMMCLFALFGCGGGGGGSTPTTTVAGVVSKGIFTSGQVKIYALNADGSKGTLLQTVSVGTDGSYTANLGSYAGAILAEASGSYKDEATGTTMQVAGTAPLRTALQSASGNITLNITPLTEIAVAMATDAARNKIDVTSINAANTTVATVFHVADIVATTPVDVTSAASATAGEVQKEYSLVLAAVSQLMQTNSQDLTTAVTQLAGAITGTGASASLATAAATNFQEALQTIAADTSKNKTGVTDVTGTPLVNIGGTTATIILSTQGSATTLNGIQVTLTLPAGITIKAASADATTAPSPLAGLVTTSGAVPAGATFLAHYISATSAVSAQLVLGLVSATSFATGEFATIVCDVAPGVTIGTASFTASSYSNLKIVDATGAIVPGITISAAVK
jgi:hypothetical protein